MSSKNLTDIIESSSKQFDNPKFLNFLNDGSWVSFSNQDFFSNIQKLTLALRSLGLKENSGFGILANSSPIWLMFNFAAISNRSISVPVFANISTENLLFEIKDSDISYFFCDSEENLTSLIKNKVKFEKIITFGFKHNIDDKNILSFEEALKIGEDILSKDTNSYDEIVKNIKADDIATIIYTSGSTGVPKGVEITHNNLVKQVVGADRFFPLKSGEDVALSFLPLAHIFEGMVMTFYLSKGISIYFADDVKNVGNLLKEIKPTLMTVVPRMLEKTYNKMFEKVELGSFIKKLIGKTAFKLALNSDPDIKKPAFHFLFNRLVYKKLVAALGGNLKMMICGGAPLSRNLEQFFTNVGVKLYVGYGLTETSPVISANSSQAKKTSTVGKKFPNIETKIIDGELLVKGEYVMKGYHNNEAKTKETIDEDGWLKTGDLAEIDDEGFIKILGRKKELFKTSGGKYVSPVPIEQQIIQNCPILTASLVIAEGKKCVTALLFADFDTIDLHKEKANLQDLTHEEFLKSFYVQDKLEKTINLVNSNLNEWEKIRKYQLITDEISIENGDLTPSMKLRRSTLEKKYQGKIDQMYDDIGK